MTPQQFLELAELLPEPCLLVTGTGEILAANASASASLCVTEERGPRTLADLADSPSDEVNRYLEACARSRSPVFGALTLRARSGGAYSWRCEGGVLRPWSAETPALLLLRLKRKELASSRFQLLNQKLEELALEVKERRRVEAALRESEQRYAQILDGVPDMVLCKLPGSVITYANRAAREYYGLAAEQIQGRTDAEIGRLDSAARRLAEDAQVFETGRSITIGREPHRRGNGEIRTCHTTKSPVFDADGRVVMLVSVMRDVTELVEQQEALEQSAAQLRELATELAQTVEALEARAAEAEAARHQADQANRAKSRFLATMSHELRTPLNAILGYGDLLEAEIAGPLNSLQKQHLGRIRGSATHLLALITEILTLARIEAGKEEVWPETVDAVALAHDAVALVQVQAAEKGLELRVDAPEGRLPIRTDTAKLRQILLNLLSNAVKFTDRGRVELRVRAEADGGTVFQVRDTGVGIEAADIERIFEPFTQVDDSTTRRAGGTGLGLPVSRRLARLLGGDVDVSSTLREGSTFTVRLPRADETPEE